MSFGIVVERMAAQRASSAPREKWSPRAHVVAEAHGAAAGKAEAFQDELDDLPPAGAAGDEIYVISALGIPERRVAGGAVWAERPPQAGTTPMRVNPADLPFSRAFGMPTEIAHPAEPGGSAFS
jgi:hypothetical protein